MADGSYTSAVRKACRIVESMVLLFWAKRWEAEVRPPYCWIAEGLNRERGRLVTLGGIQLRPEPVAGKSLAAGVYVYWPGRSVSVRGALSLNVVSSAGSPAG
jgi:hypothetical protein